MTLGEEIIEGLTELRDVLRRGDRIEDHFTVITRRLNEPHEDAADVFAELDAEMRD